MNYRISIPKPCNEDWNKMIPTEQGKYCAECQKEVLDFTHLTDKELVQRLDSGKNMCGRFREKQLNVDFHSLENTSIPLRKWWLSAASFLSLGISGQAQVEQDSLQTVQVENTNKIIREDSLFLFKAVVFDHLGPIAEATITNMNSGVMTTSDQAGKFEIRGSESDTILILNPYNLAEMEIKLNHLHACNEINLDNRNEIEFEVVVIGMPVISCKKRPWQFIFDLFRSEERKWCK